MYLQKQRYIDKNLKYTTKTNEITACYARSVINLAKTNRISRYFTTRVKEFAWFTKFAILKRSRAMNTNVNISIRISTILHHAASMATTCEHFVSLFPGQVYLVFPMKLDHLYDATHFVIFGADA